jgi:hypothetical protein
VAVNGTVSIEGQLATSGGAPVVDRRVWLIERLAGQQAATEVAMDVTGSDGSVDLSTPPLTHSVRLHLVVGQGVHSAAVRVVVTPTISASTAVQGSSYVVSVTTDGGDPGDNVTLQRRTVAGWVSVATAQLNTTGGAMFSVPVPAKRTQRYRLLLPRTQAHGFATTRFVTPPA